MRVLPRRGESVGESSMGWDFIVCPFALVAMAPQRPPNMPEPGNPRHAVPPEGAFCRNHHNDPPEHRCECDRKCEVNPDGTVTEIEDRVKCRANCFRDRCRCLSDTCDGDMH